MTELQFLSIKKKAKPVIANRFRLQTIYAIAVMTSEIPVNLESVRTSPRFYRKHFYRPIQVEKYWTPPKDRRWWGYLQPDRGFYRGLLPILATAQEALLHLD